MGKRSEAKKHGFDSWTELDLARNELAGLEYHPDPIQFTIPASTHKYTPDFKHGKYLIEVKGFIRSTDKRMYRCIAESAREQGYEFVFLFEKPQKPMTGAKKRKDGTKLTHAEWSGKVGIAWYSRDTIKEILEK